MPRHLPLACSLSAADMRVREQEIEALFGHAQDARELADGFAFVFPAGESQAGELLSFILAERACCPFLTFELTFPSPHQHLWLSLRGPDGAKEIIRAVVETALPASATVELLAPAAVPPA